MSDTKTVLEVREARTMVEKYPCNACASNPASLVLEVGHWNATTLIRLCDGCGVRLVDELVPLVGLP